MHEFKNGINLLVVRNLQHVDQNALPRGLVLQVDDTGNPLSLIYYDITGNIVLDEKTFDHAALLRLALLKDVNLNYSSPHLLHLQPAEISSILGPQTSSIPTEKEVVRHYFSNNPNEVKLSRKKSGLGNSYLRMTDQNIVALDNKDECRVVWQDNIPTSRVFSNLPTNTSAAYVVVPNMETKKYNIYYLTKQYGTEPRIVASLGKPEIFSNYLCNNNAVSQKDLEKIASIIEHEHKNQARNVLGRGGFGRVKRSKSLADESPKATKIQDLPVAGRHLGKLAGRDARLNLMRKEAKIAAAVGVGHKDVAVFKNKAYLHMELLGEPLSKVLPSLDINEKLDIAIKFLIAVGQMHNGETTNGQSYAHRDIKPDNILYDRETGAVSLIDFGFSTSKLSDKSDPTAGTLFYSALDQDVINGHLQRTSGGRPVLGGSEKSNSTVSEIIGSDLDSLDNDDADITSKSGTYISANKNVNWQNYMANPTLCLTKNYLEDDKVASLRTIFCNPEPIRDGMVPAIFTATEFASLPLPIREVFDSTNIAPLLSAERKHEGMEFFAAVLIDYKKNPDLTDDEYLKRINDLRESLTACSDLQSEFTEDLIQEKSISESTNSQTDDNTSLEGISAGPIKIKPSPQQNKSGFFRGVIEKLTGKSSRSISPITDQESDYNNDASDLKEDADEDSVSGRRVR